MVNQAANMTGRNEPSSVVTGAELNLPPIPPRPSSRYHMKKYYDDNKEAILKDLGRLGEKEMRRRWGISQATWKCNSYYGETKGLAVRWGLVKPETSTPAKTEPLKEKKVKTAAPEKVEKNAEINAKTVSKHHDADDVRLVEAEYKGYRQAVIDIFGQSAAK